MKILNYQIAFITCLGELFLALPLTAQTYTVTDGGDSNPTNYGNPGDLRYGINQANLGSYNQIVFSPSLQVSLSNSLPVIVKNLEITGNSGVQINGNGQYGLFFAYGPNVDNPISVSISDMTLTNGASIGGDGGTAQDSYQNAAGGGALGAGGALFVYNTNATVKDVVFSGNLAQGGNGGDEGGLMGYGYNNVNGCGGGGMLQGNGGSAGISTDSSDNGGGGGGGGGIGGNGGNGGSTNYDTLENGYPGSQGLGPPGAVGGAGGSDNNGGSSSLSGLAGAGGGSGDSLYGHVGGNGGASGGGGGGGTSGINNLNYAAGGGGGGFTSDPNCGGAGGSGDFLPPGNGGFGGGGGGTSNNGAPGGFGGGGAGAGSGYGLGGNGGYGGGGGGGSFAQYNFGLGGEHGGVGGDRFDYEIGAGGGGGAGLGGAVFLGPASTLTIINQSSNTVFGGNSVVPGNGGAGTTGYSTGEALGEDIFLTADMNALFCVSEGLIQSIYGTIVGDSGASITVGVSGSSAYTGTLNFYSENNYDGGTTLASGILGITSDLCLGPRYSPIIGSGGGLLALSPIALDSNRPIELTAETTTSFSAASGQSLVLAGIHISGSGTFATNGPGFVDLSTFNTGPWNTQVNGGQLGVSTASSLGSGSVSILGGSMSIINNFNGSNSFLVDGELDFSSASFPSSIGNLSGSGQILLAGNLLTTVITTDSTFSGNIISGTGGSFSKEGPQKLILSGQCSFTGPTTVSNGELAILAPFASSISVDVDGTLSGTGTITGDVSILGTYAPGASPGLQMINGAYTLGAGAVFLEEINPTYANQLVVNGPVTFIDGSSFVLNPDSGIYALPITYPDPVITATSFIGSLPPVTFVPLLPASLSAIGNSIYLTILNPNPITSFVASGNAGSVAATIDTVVTSGSEALIDIYSSLISLPTDNYTKQLDNALNQMQPAQFSASTLTLENNAVLVQRALTQRMEPLQDMQYCLCTTKEKKRLTIWVNGLGDFLHQGPTFFFQSPQYSYQANTGGFAGGVDYSFLNTFYFGALGAYTHSTVKWQQNQGKANLDTGYGGLYASVLGKMLYSNLSVIGSATNFDEYRNIIYPGVYETTKNSHQGQQALAHFDTGINLAYKAMIARPFESLDWIFQRENKYVETGGGEWNLSTKNNHSLLLRNELGCTLAICQDISKTNVSFDAKLSWIREVRVSGKTTQTAFLAAPTVPFKVIGYFPNRNLISAGTALTLVTLQDLLTTTLYYNGTFGKNYSENNFGAEMNLNF